MQDERPRRGTLRRILRWVPLATLVGTAALLVALVLGGGVAGAFAWLLLPELVPLIGACVLVGTLFHAIRKRRWKSPAVRATLAGSLAAIAVYPVFRFHPMAYPASLERTAPAAAVRLPANVPLQVAWGGDDIRANYHVASPDQRWAYDLAVRPFLVGSAKLEDYGCYGVPVVAPASGVVTAARDGEPDATPDPLHENRSAPFGNHVSIRLDSTGTHLVIAHLQRGSVAVRPGTRVREGEVVGRCGNSGNTTEPHIHIHHQRQDPATVDQVLTEGLPLYFRDHDGEPMPRGGFEERDGAAVAVGATVRHLSAKS
jgi:hypothetical protein